MSAFDTKRTCQSAFGGKADIYWACPMSAFDAKRTWRATVVLGYCFAGVGAMVPAAGFFGFCWAVFFFGGRFTNRLKQLRRSSSSFKKRQSSAVLAGADTCFGAGFILSS